MHVGSYVDVFFLLMCVLSYDKSFDRNMKCNVGESTGHHSSMNDVRALNPLENRLLLEELSCLAACSRCNDNRLESVSMSWT